MTTTKPIIALMYDFDKTLCTKDMQEYTFIPMVKMSAEDFWGQTQQKKRYYDNKHQTKAHCR